MKLAEELTNSSSNNKRVIFINQMKEYMYLFVNSSKNCRMMSVIIHIQSVYMQDYWFFSLF